MDLIDQVNASANCMAYEVPTKMATITASVLMTIFLLIGVFGNAWTLWILFRCTKLRQNLINNLIMSLCANDIINLTFVQTFVLATYYCNRWALGTLSCYIVPEANMILVGTSLWHHAFIALHRYLVVVQWNFYLRIKKRLYIRIVILGSRVFPLVLTLVFNSISYVNFSRSRGAMVDMPQTPGIPKIEAFFRSFIFYSPYLLRCVYKRSEKERIICVLVLTVIVPCIIVSVCFTSIFIHVRRKGLLMGRKFPSQQKVKLKEPIQKPPVKEFSDIQIRVNSFESFTVEEENLRSEPVHFADDVSSSTLGPESENGNHIAPPLAMYHHSSSADPIPGRLKVANLRKKRPSFSFAAHSIDKKRISRELGITKMFGVVFLLFLAGYLPYGFIRMMDRTSIDPQDCAAPGNGTSVVVEKQGTPPDIYVFLSVLYAIASCCNPLIFGVMHRDVRKNATKSFRNLTHHRWP